MTNDGRERRRDVRVGVNLLARVKYQQVDEFIEHFAVNISRSGLFIQSRKPYPKGTVLNFEVQLKGGQVVVRGKGEVAWSRGPADPEGKPQVPGMGVKFIEMDASSRALVQKILKIKAGREALSDAPGGTARRPAGAARPEEPAQPHLPPVEIDMDMEMEEEAADLDGLDVDISVDDFMKPASDQALTPARAADLTPSRIIGIDLGTTNSRAAVVIDGKLRMIPFGEGQHAIPSIVACAEDGSLLVGHSAREQMEIDPRYTFYGSKRLMGRPFHSLAVRKMKGRFSYEIIEGLNHEAAVYFPDRRVNLQQVSACILQKIRSAATEMLGEDVSHAVISVPAHFTGNQREAIREAGLLAGFQVKWIITESTAAALADGYGRSRPDQRILIYDLGGGTFEVSVLELCGNVCEVVATCGDSFMGGVDFDDQLANYLLSALVRQVGMPPEISRTTIHRLRRAAEQAKCELSDKEMIVAILPVFGAVKDTHENMEINVSRSILEEMVSPLVERTLTVAMAVLEKAGLKLQQLDDILLVGGQSRMPLIRRRIRETFGKDPNQATHPVEAVAIGAALLADSVGKIDSVVLIDVLPTNIGIDAPDGRFVPVLQSGSPLPTSMTSVVRTSRDNQDTMKLSLFQGESDRVVDNEYLSTVTISGIPRAPKEAVQIEISFSLDRECLLNVSSRELGTGKAFKTNLVKEKGWSDPTGDEV